LVMKSAGWVLNEFCINQTILGVIENPNLMA
jgi:hypothetical protein